MNDKVEFVCPEQVDYHEKVGYFRNFYSSWYNDPEQAIKKLVNHGMTKIEAQKYIEKDNNICSYTDQHKDEITYSWFRGKTITFGKK